MNQSPTTRRLFLRQSAATTAAIAAAAAVPVIADAQSADAELIQACTEFDALERDFLALHGKGPKAIEPIWAAQRPVLDRICRLQASTLDGLKTRVRTALLENKELDPSGSMRQSCSAEGRGDEALMERALALRWDTPDEIEAIQPQTI